MLMIDFKTIFNYTYTVFSLTVVFIGLILVTINTQISKKLRLFFIGLFSVQLIFVLSTLLLQYAVYSGNLALYSKTEFLECAIAALLMAIFSAFLFSIFGINIKSSVLYYFVCALCVIYTVLIAVSHRTTIFYHYTPDGEYVRSRWYFILAIPAMLILVTDLIVLIVNRKKIEKTSHFILYLVFLVTPLAVTAVQIICSFEELIVYSVLAEFGLSVVACALNYLTATRSIRTELEHQRANNLILQMRPHFIYNTMMSIYYLCEQDPKRAQYVTLNFSKYLQKNFSALSKKENIPFSEELAHTKAYLAVEQTRFDDKLTVIYDTPCTDFTLPALTLQPIVENAVKHGIDPEHESIHIYISTRKTDTGYEIRIQDDGAPFETTEIKPGEALSNIQERLKTNCRGEINVSFLKPYTVVTIKLPESIPPPGKIHKWKKLASLLR